MWENAGFTEFTANMHQSFPKRGIGKAELLTLTLFDLLFSVALVFFVKHLGKLLY